MSRGGKRENAGRKAGSTKYEGMPSKVVRVSSELDNRHYQVLPELLALLSHYETLMDEARQRGESMRTYDKLGQLLEEVKSLGL